MLLATVIENLQLEQVTNLPIIDTEIAAGYVSDLLSNVMGQTAENYLWVTMQGHPNIAAIGSLLSLAAIIVAGNASIDEETLKRANENQVLIFKTELSSFEIVGRLYQLGIKGNVK